jgi:PAS domain S-box-containing protein
LWLWNLWLRASAPVRDAPAGLPQWRERILLSLYIFGATLGMVAFVAGSYSLLGQGRPAAVWANLALYLAGITVMLHAQRIGFLWRTLLAVAILHLIGIVVLAAIGPFSGGFTWIFSSAVLAGLLLGVRASLLALAVNTLTFTALGVALTFDWLPWARAIPNAGTVWISSALNVLFLNAIVAVSAATMMGGLIQTLAQQATATRQLDQERQDLIRLGASLQAEIQTRQEAEAQQVRLASELRAMTHLLESVLDAIPDIIGVMDGQRRIIRYNAAGYRALKLTPEQARGRYCYELFGSSAPCEECAHSEALDTQRAARLEKFIPDSGRWLDVRSYPVLDDSGAIVRLIEHVRDITEDKRAAEQRQQLETQLRQAQKLEAIGTLAGGVAHDFNNLLMGIMGRTTLAMMDLAPGSPGRDHLEAIDQYVRRAAALTRQLLGFARGGKYEIKTTDLNALVSQATELFGRTHKAVRLDLDLQPGLWRVQVDRNQIDQTLLNLMVNAAQAMPDGGCIRLETRNCELEAPAVQALELPAGRYVRLTVADSGTGMDAATLERVFEPFFTTKPVGQGTGLGLASVYGIIKSHRGGIQAASIEGQGSTFTIHLPAAEGEPEALEQKAPASAAVARGSGTVLIVDDEAMILDVGQKMLRRLGYEPITAQSGEQALERFREAGGNIDLVILDMIMPGMDGRATFAQLKALDPQVRVLLSTGFSLDGPASELLEHGCQGVIQKPFTVEQLSEKLKTLLAR